MPSRYEISRAFVEAKAKVIMVNRNWDHGSAAIRSIKKDFGSDAPVEWIHCDLGNLEETRKVFCTIREKEERLDIVRLLTRLPVCPLMISFKF